MNYSIIDLIFALVVLGIGIFAAIQGFIKEIFNKASFVIAILAAFVFYNVLGELLEPVIKNKIASQVCAFVAIFIVVFLVIKVIQIILSKIFSGEIISGLDHALGFLLGIAEGFAVVFFVLLIITKQPWFDVSSITDNSIAYKIFQNLLPALPVPDQILPVQEPEIMETETQVALKFFEGIKFI